MDTKAVVFGLVSLALVFGLLLAPTTAGTAQAACKTYTNIRAVDEGGGTPTDRKFFLYVYGTTNGSGTTYYYYNGGSVFKGWVKTDWKAVGLTPDGRGVKIGVSTWWAYNHWPWTWYSYKYVLC